MPLAIAYGALRSGTTMLRLMLDGHSELSCIGEHDYLFDHLHWDRDGWRYNLAQLSEDRIFQSQALELPDESFVNPALSQLLEQIARRGGKKFSVLMLHRNVDKAISLLPDASFIHLVRDPRDVANSRVSMGWNGNAYCAVENWIETESQWKSASEAIKQIPLDLRYESLVREPERELAALCEFLGVSYEESLLAYPAYSTYNAPDASLAEQWRSRMSVKDQRLVEARLGLLLSASGYVSNNLLPANITSSYDALLRLDNAIGRHVYALRRYGFLHVKSVLGRRLGIASMEKSARRRMQRILTDQFLR